MHTRRRDRKRELLDIAERFFREQNYTNVSLGQVAREAGIRKPTIYHHFPGGKEELFVAVQIRMFERVGCELREAIRESGSALPEQLHAAAAWFLRHPPMFILSMIHNDMSELSPEGRILLGKASYGLIMGPLMDAVKTARAAGTVRGVAPQTVAGAFLALLESNTIAHRAGFGSGDLTGMMAASVDVILHGVLLHPDGSGVTGGSPPRYPPGADTAAGRVS
ncbi:MAG: TetR/AcrR family transcriptional regulator [Spirochaetaceae bacterium]|nr:MAG: TetR/AcrR family transcriptional regulator [Spirochaetaceae bacterium]